MGVIFSGRKQETKSCSSSKEECIEKSVLRVPPSSTIILQSRFFPSIRCHCVVSLMLKILCSSVVHCSFFLTEIFPLNWYINGYKYQFFNVASYVIFTSVNAAFRIKRNGRVKVWNVLVNVVLEGANVSCHFQSSKYLNKDEFGAEPAAGHRKVHFVARTFRCPFFDSRNYFLNTFVSRWETSSIRIAKRAIQVQVINWFQPKVWPWWIIHKTFQLRAVTFGNSEITWIKNCAKPAFK